MKCLSTRVTCVRDQQNDEMTSCSLCLGRSSFVFPIFLCQLANQKKYVFIHFYLVNYLIIKSWYSCQAMYTCSHCFKKKYIYIFLSLFRRKKSPSPCNWKNVFSRSFVEMANLYRGSSSVVYQILQASQKCLEDH